MTRNLMTAAIVSLVTAILAGSVLTMYTAEAKSSKKKGYDVVFYLDKTQENTHYY